MNDSDLLWQQKWSRSFFPPPVPNFHDVLSSYSQLWKFSLFGSDEEPLSSIWMASLSQAMGEYFREGLTVLDYGCGGGRYCGFLAERLSRFQYYGVEKRGSWVRHGEKSIRAANRIFRHEPRAKFGFINSTLETEALHNANVVLLGSIFTHVDVKEVGRMLSRFAPLIERGGRLVFSVFIADQYRVHGPGAYGFADCYESVWLEALQLTQLAERNNWQLTERESFLAQGANLHRIFALNKSNHTVQVAI